jgi:MscS family membrane protein
MFLNDPFGLLADTIGRREELAADFQREDNALEELEVHMVPRLTMTILLFSVLLVSTALGQTPGVPPPMPPTQAAPANPDPLGRDTPRGTVLGFIKAANAGNMKRAAEYLDARRFPKLAEQRALELKVVMDRWVSPRDLDQLSDEVEGDRDDALPPGVDRVGIVKSATGPLDLLLDQVRQGKNPPIWLFSAATLRGIPSAYEEIRPLWIERFIWPPLRETRFLDLPLWRWMLLPLAMTLVLVVVWLLGRALFAVLAPLLFRLTRQRAVTQLARIKGPVRLTLLSLVMFGWLSGSQLPLLLRLYFRQLVAAIAIASLAWLFLRLIEIAARLWETHLRYLNQTGRIAVMNLIQRLSKALVVVIAVLTLIYLAGFNLTAALAGLGIGGIAVAFAAQKTLESLFGGILIISDRPIRVGDFCKVGNLVGTVEDIGLRSTRIRTLDRTVVAIPNGQMAAENLENYGARDKIWFRPTIGLRYETRADHLRYVLAEVRRMLYEHPMVETPTARIRFVRFGGSSLDLEVFAYVLTSDYGAFLEVQEDLLLRIMDIIEASGTGVAFPSSTTYLTRDSGLDAAKTQKAIATVERWREEKELPFPDFHPAHISEFKDRLEYPRPDSAVHGSHDST